MGWTWEVSAYVPDASPSGYGYEQIYAGESAWRAIRAARAAKKAGAGCVKVEWRP